MFLGFFTFLKLLLDFLSYWILSFFVFDFRGFCLEFLMFFHWIIVFNVIVFCCFFCFSGILCCSLILFSFSKIFLRFFLDFHVCWMWCFKRALIFLSNVVHTHSFRTFGSQLFTYQVIEIKVSNPSKPSNETDGRTGVAKWPRTVQRILSQLP